MKKIFPISFAFAAAAVAGSGWLLYSHLAESNSSPVSSAPADVPTDDRPNVGPIQDQRLLALAGDDPARQKAAIQLQECALAKDPAYQAWLDAYLASTIEKANPAKLQARLDTLLADVPTDCERLSAFGVALYKLTNDYNTAGIICAAALNAGHAELSVETTLSAQDRELITAMKESEPVVWASTDNGPRSYVDELDAESSDILRLVPADDQSGLGWTVNWARIVQAEVHYLRRQYDQSLSAAKQMSTDMEHDSHWRESQKIAVHWITALTLWNTRHFEQSVSHLRYVADHQTSDHAEDASLLLIHTLCQLHQDIEAVQRYDKFMSEPHSPHATTESVTTVVNAARKRLNASTIIQPGSDS